MQNYTNGEAETIKNENHLQVRGPFSCQFQPHFLLAGQEMSGRLCFVFWMIAVILENSFLQYLP